MSRAFFLDFKVRFGSTQQDCEHGLDVPPWRPALTQPAPLVLVILIAKNFDAPRQFIECHF